jgi:O-antigen/teichoic acid export membrane protein
VLRSLFQNTIARQSGVLFIAQLVNALLGIGITIANTRLLSVDDFGIFSFVTSTVLFIGWFFDFGLFSAGSRLMAVIPESPERGDERKLAGAMVVLTGGVSIVFGLCIVLLSFFVDQIFSSHIGSYLLLLAPLVTLFPFQGMLTLLFRGSNEIGKLAFHVILPRLLYCVAIGVIVITGRFSLLVSLVLYFGALALAILCVAALARPDFSDVRTRVWHIVKEIREFGIHIYSGTIVDNLTTGSDKLLISYVLGATSVGYYSVAQTVVLPISMFARAIGISIFKRFASLERIPRNIFIINSIWIAGLAGVVIFGNQWIVRYVFSEKYDAVHDIVPILACGMIFSGWNEIYHSFFSARRLGKYMRNISITTSTLNVAADIALIPLLGLLGAALADAITYILDYGLNRYYYRQYNRSGNTV